MNDKLKRLDEIASAATAGPWKVGTWRDVVFAERPKGQSELICRVKRNNNAQSNDNPDMRDALHIATFGPDNVKRMVDIIRRQHDALLELAGVTRPDPLLLRPHEVVILAKKMIDEITVTP